MQTYNDLPINKTIGIAWVGNLAICASRAGQPLAQRHVGAAGLTLRNATTDEDLVLAQRPISFASLHDSTVLTRGKAVHPKGRSRLVLSAVIR